MRRHTGIVTGIVLGWVCQIASADEPVAMKVKYQAGKRYVQRLEISQTEEMSRGPQAAPVQSQSTITHDMSLAVLKRRPDGSHEIQLTFDAVKVSVNVGAGQFAFDSGQDRSRDGGNLFAAAMRGMVGAKLRMVADATGRIKKVEGFDEMLDRMAAQNPMVRALVGRLVNVNLVKDMSGQLTAAGLPGKPVQPGDTWAFKIEPPTGQMASIVTQGTCTFEKWDAKDGRRCALIAQKGAVVSKPLPEGRSGMMTVTVKEGKMTGRTWFDPELGWAVRIVSDSNTVMERKMNVPAGGNRPGGQRSMSTKMSQRQTITLVRIEDLPTQP